MSTSTPESNGHNLDPEKGALDNDTGKISPIHDTPEWDREVAPKEPWKRRFIDSFKRDPNLHVTKPAQGVDATAGKGFDHKRAAEATANSGLQHKLKSRHMQMIAIGGSIGK